MEAVALYMPCCRWAPSSLIRVPPVPTRAHLAPATHLKVCSIFPDQKNLKLRENRLRTNPVRKNCLRVMAHGAGPSGPPVDDHVAFFDDMSRFIYRKLNALFSPYLPKNVDYLDWLPENIHNRLHNSEFVATLVVREIFHFGLLYVLYERVDGFCSWLHWLYHTKLKPKPKKTVSVEDYQTSNFQVATDPLRLVIASWALTRLVKVVASILNMTLGVGTIAKVRQTIIVGAVTWFFFKWKHKYVQHLSSLYKLDAPRILAFDKVVSLIMYFVALSCVGEVNGFALRSLLAVGGFSGVALGLAAKEIVSNFFGGAVLFITRPFVVGERIKAGNFVGYVQDIGFLQTKILSMERMPMVVPNQNFINQVITNYSRATCKLLEAQFPVRVQDVFFVDRITTRVLDYLRAHPEVDVQKFKPLCYLQAVQGDGAHIVMSCVIKVAGGSEFYRIQQAIQIRVAEIIVSEGATLGNNGQWAPAVPSWSMVAETPAGILDGRS